jgi:hypothetical protein
MLGEDADEWQRRQEQVAKVLRTHVLRKGVQWQITLIKYW